MQMTLEAEIRHGIAMCDSAYARINVDTTKENRHRIEEAFETFSNAVSEILNSEADHNKQ